MFLCHQDSILGLFDIICLFSFSPRQNEHVFLNTASLAQDVYTFELAPRDTLSGERIWLAFCEIQNRVFFGEKLRFRPVSELHKTNIAATKQIPTIDTTSLFKGIKYQPLTEGQVFGLLRLLRRTDSEATILDSLDPTSILLCDEIPTDLPAVRCVYGSLCHSKCPHMFWLRADRWFDYF